MRPGDHDDLPDWLPKLMVLSLIEHWTPTEQKMFWGLVRRFRDSGEPWAAGPEVVPERWTRPLGWRDVLADRNGHGPKERAAKGALRSLCEKFRVVDRIRVGRAAYRYRLKRPKEWPHDEGGEPL